jgi:DNA polymerase III epsilon subunit-like protein
MKKVLWLDVETTGLDCKKHGLREVGFIIEIDGVEVDKGVFKINPFTYTTKDVVIDDYALEISKVSIEDLESYDSASYCFKELMYKLVKYVNVNDKNDCFVIAGYSVAFDIGFLKEWFKEMGLQDSYKDLFHYKSLDVFVFALRQLGLNSAENDKLKIMLLK